MHGVEVLCVALRQSVDPRQSAAVKTLLISGCVDGTVKEWGQNLLASCYV